ncbi:hypothetical protein KP509_19G039700 [Ceratopteris richardii]|uniref:Uncharacterized protein n=1 Tax=Ceratopteris richardii TaxID=49495 RepID=A0A8T2SLM0_CERRI|nr:hypothetical protein KP509_19G039700 [Ceratopteris richardii]
MKGVDMYRYNLQEHWRREMGLVKPHAFARHVGGWQDLIRRFHLHAELEYHTGCVNTVHFNSSGDILVSGSDDRQIALWDWGARMKRFSFYSGHEDNVFQARIMPFSDNKKIISCSADGQFDLRDPDNKSMFKCHGLTGISKRRRHPVRLHCIVMNSRNSNYFAVGGSDIYARVYDIRKTCWGERECNDNHVEAVYPAHLRNKGPLHVTALAYSHQEELLVSYSDEQIYLFEKDMPSVPASSSDMATAGMPQAKEPQAFRGHRNAYSVKGVSFLGPNSEYVVSGSDCGNIFIWKKKDAELVSLFKGDNQVVNCLEPHPHATVLATSGIEHTAKVWAPISEDYVPLPDNAEKIMESNQRGREEGFQRLTDIIHIMRLQRRHDQPMLVSLFSQRGNRRNTRHGEGDEDSDDDGSTVNGYLMVLHGGANDSSDTEDDVDPQYSVNECAVI